MNVRTQLLDLELDALYTVSQILNSTLELKIKLQGILEILHKKTGMRSGMVTLREIDTDSMIVYAVYNDDSKYNHQETRYQPGEGMIGRAIGLKFHQ